MKRSWLLAAVLPCLWLAPLAAQVEVENPDVGVTGEETQRYMEEKRRAMKADGSENDKEAALREAEAMAKLTPEERLARSVVNGAGAFCTFETSLEPRRLLPGQTGILTVMMILRGDAVLPAPPPVTLRGPAQQQQLTLGSLNFREPKLGALPQNQAYRGKPVYEEIAIFDIPVTAASDAKLGSKIRVSVELQFDLYSGATGQAVGRFMDRAGREIEIGQAPGKVQVVPDTPAPAAASSTPRASNPVAEPVTPPVDDGGHAAVTPLPVPEASSAHPSSSPAVAGPDASGESSGMPYLLVGGGALVLVVALLALRKR
ncbi:MAG: hypothetical protein IPK26_31870 [Planctomycetes bacterium]|nr:hypothetical protein [Planctomycetota bacterium]